MRAGQARFRLQRTARQLGYSEEKATEILSQPEITAIADIKMGTEEASAWGCDLTYDYIKIKCGLQKLGVEKMDKSMQSIWTRRKFSIEALPYIQRFNRKIIVSNTAEAPCLTKSRKKESFRTSYC